MRLWSYLLVLCVGAVCGEEVVVSRAARELDLTSHLVKQSVSLTVLNEGERPLTSVLYTLEQALGSKLAYIGARVRLYRVGNDKLIIGICVCMQLMCMQHTS